VKDQRWPWLVTAGLMLAAAAATGRSTYLYWLPCRGSMLRGSVINYYVEVGRKFSPACEQAMDGDIALVVPWTSGLNLVAMALLGVAWLTLVVGLRWRWRTRAVAALPGLATLAVAVAGVFQEVADLPDADELMTYVDRWGVHTSCFDDE